MEGESFLLCVCVFAMSAADIEGLPSYPIRRRSTSPMSCTLPFVAFPVCVCVFLLICEEGLYG